MDDAALNAYITALSAIVRPVRAADYPRPLEPFRALLRALGDPHTAFPAVVVAGSIGKGTACHQIAAALAAGGLRPALYTGPHLHSFRERFVCDGAMISPPAFVEGVSVVTAAAASAAPGHAFSTFELATALALWWFSRRHPDVLVLECGLGGRFDAVGCLPNTLAAFTPIELEHAAMLGGTLETIAWHKAGIIQPGGLAVTVPQPPLVMRVLQSEAARVGARLLTDPQPLPLALFSGRSAAETGADSVVALYNALLPPPASAQASGAATSPLPPGRGERVYVGERAVVIDGGHTPGAARWLRGLIDLLVGSEAPVRLVVGMLVDKNAAGYLRAFDQPRCRITLTRVPGHRAAEPQALAAAAGFQQASVEIQPEPLAALRAALAGAEALLVIGGSLRLAALAREALGLLPPELAVEARATRALFEGPDYLSRLA